MARNRRRRNKKLNKHADLLLTDESIRGELGESSNERVYYSFDRENVVSRMNQGARDEALKIINDRYDTTHQATMDVRKQMDKDDKQYKGIWQDDAGESEERIFIPKTREEINNVRNFIVSIVSQLDPLVRFDPMGSDIIYGEDIDYKRAKVAEALFQYDIKEIGNFIDDEFITFITHVLKYSMGVLECVYNETNYAADLQWKSRDRGMLFLDPFPQKFEDLRYMLHEYYVPLPEVYARVDAGDWFIPNDDMQNLETMNVASEGDIILDRIFGKRHADNQLSEDDELVKCYNYWQGAREGLPDVYAVMVGGIDSNLARFGRIPYPYKQIPFLSLSYNPDDRPDGEGLAQMLAPLQKVINTYFNFRSTDVAKNITTPYVVAPELIGEETMQDLEDGQTFVRADEALTQKIMQDPNLSFDKFMAKLGPTGTSTMELLTHDLPMVMEMLSNTSNVTDAMKGQRPQPGEPLGIHQERVIKSATNFTMILRQLMRTFERMAGVNMTFYRDEIFWPTERIVRLIGKTKYKDVLESWHQSGDNTFFKSIGPDDVDVDVTFNARSGIEAQASKTLFSSQFSQWMQAIGQNPEIVSQMMEKVDFTDVFKQTVNVSGLDTEEILLTDKEIQERQQKQQQQKQQAMQDQQQQMMLQLKFEEAKAQIETKAIIAQEQAKAQMRMGSQLEIDQAKGQVKALENEHRINVENDAKLEQIITKANQDLIADIKLAILEGEIEKQRETHEAKLEKQAGVKNVSEAGGGNVDADTSQQ